METQSSPTTVSRISGLLKAVACSLAALSVGATALTHANFADAKAAYKAKDYATALTQYRRVGRIGYADASAAVADMLADGKGTPADNVSAYAWFRLAEDQGKATARQKAKRIFRKLSASEQMDAEAQAAALLSSSGRAALDDGLNPQSYNSVYKNFRPETTPGLEWPAEFVFRPRAASVWLEYDVDAQGKPRDFQLLRKAPQPFVREAINHLQRQTQLSVAGAHSIPERYTFYITNRSEGAANYGEAKLLRKLKKRAEQGSPYRKYFYANALELQQGMHSNFDPGQFNPWYLRAAQGGHAASQYIMGSRLLFGLTMQADYKKALRWLHLAAENSNANAQYLLGMLDDNDEQKYAWLRKAAGNGHTTAMLKVARRLADTEQTQAAEQLLQDAQAHLDQVRWHEVAAHVYRDDPARLAEISIAGQQLAQQAGLTWQVTGTGF
ncbi:MAG: hypothetical protein AAF529_00825 [Pseudomonadota bacterium]